MCNTEANVNSKSVVLEVQTKNDEVMRISLEINEKELLTKEYMLFQGQIIAVHGSLQ